MLEQTQVDPIVYFVKSFEEVGEEQTGKVVVVPTEEENAESITITVNGEETDTVVFDKEGENIAVRITIIWIDGTETQIRVTLIPPINP